MTDILVFQHIEYEDLGLLNDLLLKEGVNINYVKFYKGEKIPDKLDNFSMLIVLGGPMNTNMEEKYPWLKEEKNTIRKFVIELGKPFFGFCLGCQLLGEVLGATIKRSKQPEIGFHKIFLNDLVKNDRIFKDFPREFNAFHWHSNEVVDLVDPKIKILGYSKSSPIQLFKYSNNAYGIQFHIEIKDDTIQNWCSNKDYLTEIQEKIGNNALDLIEKEKSLFLEETNKLCKLLSLIFLEDLRFDINSRLKYV